MDETIIIETEDWIAVYFKGEMFAEGPNLTNIDWIKLGMLMNENNCSLLDIREVYIEEFEWSFPNNIDDLNEEVKKLIV